MTMKKLFPIVATLLVLAISGCAPQVDVEAERAALLTADEAWSQSAADLDGFMSFVADDASMLPFDVPIATGEEAIRAVFSALSSAPGFALSWSATGAVVSRAGDLGYTIGTFELTVNDAEGNPVTTVGKYVTVWRKQADGQWKVVADIFNRDAPAPSE
jgi:ketosteroid isomerase-like protein